MQGDVIALVHSIRLPLIVECAIDETGNNMGGVRLEHIAQRFAFWPLHNYMLWLIKGRYDGEVHIQALYLSPCATIFRHTGRRRSNCESPLESWAH
jgi:hypothetical protein